VEVVSRSPAHDRRGDGVAPRRERHPYAGRQLEPDEEAHLVDR
jgi:hypothetical protein